MADKLFYDEASATSTLAPLQSQPAESIESYSHIQPPLAYNTSHEAKGHTGDELTTLTAVQLFATIMQAQDEKGRQLCAMFIRLPTRRELPMYYRMISNPMDMSIIRDRIKVRH